MTRNKNLDGARGLAALSVALAHCDTHYTGIQLYASTVGDFRSMDAVHIALRLWHSFFNGDAAVIVFFALSGYVLGRSLEKVQQTPAHELIPYVIRRVFRLYPVSIVAGAFAFLVFPITVHQMIGTMFITDISVNGVLWSLQVELLGSAVIFCLWAVNSRALVCAILACYAYLFWYVPIWAMVVSSNFIMLPAVFVLGFAIPMIPSAIWRSRTLLIIGLAALLFSDLFMGRGWHTRIGQVLGAFALVGCLHGSPIAWLNRRTIQFLGEVSYPFYLIHALMAFVCQAEIERFAPNDPLLTKVLLLVITSIPISLLMAWVISKLVEKPGMRIGASLLSIFPSRSSRVAS